jgi:hypothetical protein
MITPPTLCRRYKLDRIPLFLGSLGSVVIEALCYKPEGRRFDTQIGKFLNLSNPSIRSRPWGLLSIYQK